MAEAVNRLSFLILVHKNPGQLQRLVDYLLKNNATVFIHIDKKAKHLFFDFLKHNIDCEHLFVYSKYKVRWGGYKQIKATFFLLNEALQYSDFSHVCLLSGQDVPIRPLSEFKSFLQTHPDNSFVANYALPAFDQLAGEGGMDRLRLYWLPSFPGGLKKLSDKLNVVVHRLQNRHNWFRDLNYNFYAGANWFTLSKSAAEYVCRYMKEFPKFLWRFRNTRSADEIFLQTILMNSNQAHLVVNDHLRMIDWSANEAHPGTYKLKDASDLLTSSKFFARKFDEAIDNKVIDEIYSKI